MLGQLDHNPLVGSLASVERRERHKCPLPPTHRGHSVGESAGRVGYPSSSLRVRNKGHQTLVLSFPFSAWSVGESYTNLSLPLRVLILVAGEWMRAPHSSFLRTRERHQVIFLPLSPLLIVHLVAAVWRRERHSCTSTNTPCSCSIHSLFTACPYVFHLHNTQEQPPSTTIHHQTHCMPTILSFTCPQKRKRGAPSMCILHRPHPALITESTRSRSQTAE